MGDADDRLAILDAVARYAHAWDDKDARAYAACFAEDGLLEVWIRGRDEPVIREQGRAAIERWAARTHRGELPGLRPPDAAERTRHAPGGTVFDALEADAARTRTMLFETRVAGGASAPAPQVAGVYDDGWRRTAAGWLIARRVLRMDRQ